MIGRKNILPGFSAVMVLAAAAFTMARAETSGLPGGASSLNETYKD
jgi:hypothetical protein